MNRVYRLARCSVQRFVLGLGLTAICMLAAVASAAEVHVAPEGKPDGDGSLQKPYDIFTVFAGNAPVKPGDTVLLSGGRYDGLEVTKKNRDGGEYTERSPFTPKLRGTRQQPIVVTSASGEWAHLNGAVQIDGCDFTHFVRLEIGDLKWDPYQEKHRVPTAFNAVRGNKIKLINCNVFGGAMGTGLWRPALDMEAYGNLIHDFGTMERKGGRGHGHAFYIQNDVGTKTLEHNIAYRGCGWNYDIYTQQGEIKGFDILENIGFIPGWYKEGQTSFNFGLTGWKPAERIRFIGNVGYQPRDMQKWRSNMRLMFHYKKDVIHDEALVKDNYVMGAYRAMVVSRWRKMEITGNTFWATGYLMEVSSGPSGSGVADNPPKPELKCYAIDSNTYYDNGVKKPFVYSTKEQYPEEDTLTFAEWQKLGLDSNSTMLPGRNGKPTGTKVFVFPNKYEKGRANIAVFNWDGKDKVEVDLTGALAQGQMYAIYNCLDIKQTIERARPVRKGVFGGQPIELPMRGDRDCPDFDAFLVLPLSPARNSS
ncbi:MAG: hypothetical protein H8E44_41545 [Planctomycetes bacterium]|nr:hypothetical protein [Planctomycetota bacterium]